MDPATSFIGGDIQFINTCHPEAQRRRGTSQMPAPSRRLHKVQFEGQRVFVRFLAFARNDNAKKPIQVLVALTFPRSDSLLQPSRQGSSAVEQGTHKPLVGSSILPPGNFNCLEFTFFVDQEADVISVQQSMFRVVLLSIYGAIQAQLSVSATSS